MKEIIFTGSLMVMAAAAPAATISLNFTDHLSADSTMGPGDVAGAPGVAAANWNNLDVNGGGLTSDSSLVYDDSSAVAGGSVSWQTDLANWRLGHAVVDGHDRMWKGYLDAQNSATVTVTGLSFVGGYDVYVYFDGSNGANWRKAGFTIGATTEDGEDSENATWGEGQNAAKVYQLPVPGAGGNSPFPTSPNNDEGNYVIISGVTGSSFVMTAGGVGGALFRAPINGIQIVGAVPEPSVGALGLLGGLLLLRRRR